MSTPGNKPSEDSFTLHPRIVDKPVGIVSTEWNRDIIEPMLKGAQELLAKYQIPEEKIFIREVPGAFELPLGSQLLMEYAGAQGVICLGCLIKGETPHFHYIAEAVSTRIIELNLTNNIPAIFGVLTTENREQALARAGGDKGNKGEEAALALLKMLSLKEELKEKTYGKIGLYKRD